MYIKIVYGKCSDTFATSVRQNWTKQDTDETKLDTTNSHQREREKEKNTRVLRWFFSSMCPSAIFSATGLLTDKLKCHQGWYPFTSRLSIKILSALSSYHNHKEVRQTKESTRWDGNIQRELRPDAPFYAACQASSECPNAPFSTSPLAFIKKVLSAAEIIWRLIRHRALIYHSVINSLCARFVRLRMDMTFFERALTRTEIRRENLLPYERQNEESALMVCCF